MKRICIGLCVLLGFVFFLGGCTDNSIKGIAFEELIEVAENAQYLPSRELLVKNKQTYGIQHSAFTLSNNDVTPRMLLNGGFSDEEYEALIETISPIDTAFDRDLTVSEAKNLVIQILSEGIILDQWFSYEEGELKGCGKFYITNEKDSLTITRLSSFQPWIYNSETGEYLDNDDFPENENKPNYPIRSDAYLRIGIYNEDGKEVVECEVVENLSYYGKITPISYQFVRNVKDTSFTKLQIVSRSCIPDPNESGGWGYDIDTNLPYGYQREFMQLDYSDPDNIQWLEATQILPYAFDLTAANYIQFGSRSALGGFYNSINATYNDGEFSFEPSEEYRFVRINEIIDMDLAAIQENMANLYYKIYPIKDNIEEFDCNADSFTAEEHTLLNRQINSVFDSLTNLAENVSVQNEIWEPLIVDADFNCTAENTDFEELFNPCFNALTKAAIDNSELAKNYLNNEIYELGEISIMPVLM